MSTRTSGAALEDTMFFPRLRRHAKWMFVFLALVFGVGFVAFGIGAGGTGIGDIFRGSSSSGGVSVSDAREATEENPQDPQAWRDLSTALQTDGETEQAVVALEQYLNLRPKDADGLRELGALYLALGAQQRQEAQSAQIRAQLKGAGNTFTPSLIVGGVDQLENKIAAAIDADVNEELGVILSESSSSYVKAVSAYERLAAAAPSDPNVQLELAQAAEQAGSNQTAIEAYERYLELAPEDPNAPIIEQQLQRLRNSSG